MKTTVRLILLLYPRWWRERYASELEALLEDKGFSWRDGVNVLCAAATMRMKEAATIPLLATLAGAALGAGLYLQSPDEYRATATLRVPAGSLREPRSGESQAFLARVGEAVPSPEEKAATAITILEMSPASTTLRVSYVASRAEQAQIAVSRLVTAIMNSGGGETVAVLAAPGLPREPEPKNLWPLAGWTAAGLLAGLVGLATKRRRRA